MVVALADMALYDRITPAFLDSRQPQRAAAAMTVVDLNLPADSIATLLAGARADKVPLVIVAVSQPKMARLPARPGRPAPADPQSRRTGNPRRPRAADRGRRARRLPRRCRRRARRDVIVTCGSQGVFHTKGGELVWLAAHQVEVVDVTGAGDAFSAAVCWSLYQGSDDLTLACRRGLKVAAMTLESPDTVSPHAGRRRTRRDPRLRPERSPLLFPLQG
jgi:pseudouridine kinase